MFLPQSLLVIECNEVLEHWQKSKKPTLQRAPVPCTETGPLTDWKHSGGGDRHPCLKLSGPQCCVGLSIVRGSAEEDDDGRWQVSGAGASLRPGKRAGQCLASMFGRLPETLGLIPFRKAELPHSTSLPVWKALTAWQAPLPSVFTSISASVTEHSHACPKPAHVQSM